MVRFLVAAVVVVAHSSSSFAASSFAVVETSSFAAGPSLEETWLLEETSSPWDSSWRRHKETDEKLACWRRRWTKSAASQFVEEASVDR